MEPLSVLLVVEHLARRAGLSLYVRDLALELHKRGHKPIVYSPLYGEVAAELREATIPVPGRLEDIGTPPDLIHGHNQFETMQALLRFPSTPAVFSCHGWESWKNQPPIFPRVRRYLPVDDTCRDRLMLEHGIPDARICVHHNFVDLSRFAPRAALPASPARAFLFSSKFEPGDVQMLSQVCDQRGIALDVLSGEGIEQPGAVVGSYDLVFARGRCALESMAVGTAVVVCGREGLGPMVTTANFDALRPLNFGLRVFRRPATREAFDDAIGSYDAGDAAAVSRRIRDEAGLEKAVSKLLGTYTAILDEHRQAGIDYEADERATADYLAAAFRQFAGGSARTIADARRRDKTAFRKRLQAELDRLDADHARRRAEVEAAHAIERERLQVQYAQQRERLKAQIADQREHWRAEHLDERGRWQAKHADERARWQAEHADERARWQAEHASRIDRLRADHLSQIERRDQAGARLHEKLEASRAAIAEAREELAELKLLRADCARFEKERDALARARDHLDARLDRTRAHNEKLSTELHSARHARDEQRARAEQGLAALQELQAEHERLRRALRLSRKEMAALRGGLIGRIRQYLRRLPIPGAPWRRAVPQSSQSPRK